jgi:AcrR family transcriptional regulator
MTSRTDRIESREDRRAARRDQLLDDAMAAIREIGAGATMEQLARRGGVTKPILYRHFGDRDGLIAVIAERFATGLIGEIDQALLRTGSSRHELLVGTVEAYLGFIEQDPNLYRFLVRQGLTHPDGPASINPLVNSIARQVALVIGEQLRLDGNDAGAAVPWAYGIVGLVHHAGDWWLETRTMSRQALCDYLCDLLWNGLVATVVEPPPGPTS